ncbi:response regulator [Lysobacter sp. GCM10012299]|uniref:Hpt domain-containing response regulator n=1 Tax=Lysobacter sp. GCM10012299 TaxID=3317333 RepID=UPI0036134069
MPERSSANGYAFTLLSGNFCEMQTQHRRHHVLIIDDDVLVRMLLKEQFDKLGVRAFEADSGEEALLLFEAGRVCAVLTDCWMPHMDGFMLAREIRKLESRLSRQPSQIWAHTAHVDEEIEGRCRDAGMQGCIRKPASNEDLRRIVENAPRDVGVDLPIVARDREMILSQWFAQASLDLMAARAQLGSGRIDALAAQLHRIKGAARMLDQQQIARLCERAERLTKDNGRLKDALDEIQRILEGN